MRKGQKVRLKLAEYLADRDRAQSHPAYLQWVGNTESFAKLETEYRKLLAENLILTVSATAENGQSIEVTFPSGVKNWVSAKFLTLV